MAPEERAENIASSDVWERVDYYSDETGEETPETTPDRDLLKSLIAAAIREAVLEEREACARLAETHTTAGVGGLLKLTPTQGEIARAIRERPSP